MPPQGSFDKLNWQETINQHLKYNSPIIIFYFRLEKLGILTHHHRYTRIASFAHTANWSIKTPLCVAMNLRGTASLVDMSLDKRFLLMRTYLVWSLSPLGQ